VRTYKIKVILGSHVGYLPGLFNHEVYDEVDRLNIIAAQMHSAAVYLVEILH
jgi:hypothetical protein